jgi:hypothetical protein
LQPPITQAERGVTIPKAIEGRDNPVVLTEEMQELELTASVDTHLQRHRGVLIVELQDRTAVNESKPSGWGIVFVHEDQLPGSYLSGGILRVRNKSGRN